MKRTSFNASAPVEVITRDQLEYSGAQNMSDVIQYLTAASGSDFNGRGQGTWGISQINLRGLGPQATLILINGRRVVPSGAGIGTFVDIGQVPVSAIERIEVLRGGASAIYGSDAVAGVVNVITRRGFEGARVDVSVQGTDDFDQDEEVVSATLGTRSERARATVSLSYSRQTRLLLEDRDFTRGQNISAIGYPGTYIITAPAPDSGAALGVNPDPQCEEGTGAMVDEEGFCTVENRRYSALVDFNERASVYASAEYDLTNHTRLFAEAGYSRLRAEAVVSNFPTLQEIIVPANHVDNPWRSPAQLLATPLPTTEPAIINGDDDTVRGVVGIGGDFEDVAANTIAEDWDWEVYGTFGASRYRGRVPDNLTEPLQEAIDSCSDPSNLDDCFNPFYSSNDGTGTPHSDEVIDRFLGEMRWQNDQELVTGSAGLSGHLFELPGGDLGFAIGGQYRYETRGSQVDLDANQNHFAFVLGNSDASANNEIYAAYLELVWPLYNGIELQTAGRLERYESTGTNGNPSLGLTVTPGSIVGRNRVARVFRDLRLRGHFASAFRAPSIYQTFNGFVTTLDQFDGEGLTPQFRAVRTHGNSDLEPESSTAMSVGLDWAIIDELAITGDYYRYDYTDIIVAEDAQQIYRMDMNDPRIDRDANGNLIAVNTRLINAAEVVTDGIDFGAIVKLELDDAGDQTLSVGAAGTYVLSFEIPRDQVSDDVAENVVDCDDETCDVAGSRNDATFARPQPRLRVNFPLAWATQSHRVGLTVHFISSYDDDGNLDPDTMEPVEIESWTTLDLTYGYTLLDTIGRSTTLRLGVLNLLDQDPPPVETTLAHDPQTHDPRGRLIYAKIEQEF